MSLDEGSFLLDIHLQASSMVSISLLPCLLYIVIQRHDAIKNHIRHTHFVKSLDWSAVIRLMPLANKQIRRIKSVIGFRDSEGVVSPSVTLV